MKNWVLSFLLIGLVSCEKKVQYNDQYKYSVCLKILEKENISNDDHSYIINPIIKDFRFNDFSLLKHPKYKFSYQNSIKDVLKIMNLTHEEYQFATWLDYKNSFEFQKLQKYRNSKNVVRFSYIRNNLIFMDIISYCDKLTPKQLENTSETELPLLQFNSCIVKIDEQGNATYYWYNGGNYEMQCGN